MVEGRMVEDGGEDISYLWIIDNTGLVVGLVIQDDLFTNKRGVAWQS